MANASNNSSFSGGVFYPSPRWKRAKKCWGKQGYGGTHPLCMFHVFLKKTEVLAYHLSVEFRWLLHLGSFSVCWRGTGQCHLNPPPSSVANYLPISRTSVLPKVFEQLVWVHCWRFMKYSGVLWPTHFYQKHLGKKYSFKYESFLLNKNIICCDVLDFSANVTIHVSPIDAPKLAAAYSCLCGLSNKVLTE